MFLSPLNSKTRADLEFRATTGGHSTALYDSFVIDLNNDGTDEIVLLNWSLLTDPSAEVLDSPITVIHIYDFQNGEFTNVTTQYFGGELIEGYTRRLFIEDLNKDDLKDFIFIQNSEDGRYQNITGVMDQGGVNSAYVSSSLGYSREQFSSELWSHLGAVGDYDDDGLVEVIEGYFQDQNFNNGTLEFEYNDISQDFEFVRDLNKLDIAQSSGIIFDSYLITNRPYPKLHDIVAVDLLTEEYIPILEKPSNYVEVSYLGWNNFEPAMHQVRVAGSELIRDMGIGDFKIIGKNNNIIVATDDVEYLSKDPAVEYYTSTSYQDLHFIDGNSLQIIQSVDNYKNSTTYANSFITIDLNNDGFTDILPNEVVNNNPFILNIDDKIFLKTHFPYFSKVPSSELEGLNLNDFGFMISAAYRYESDLYMFLETQMNYKNIEPDGTITFTPSYDLLNLGLSPKSGDFGAIYRLPLQFSVDEVIRWEFEQTGQAFLNGGIFTNQYLISNEAKQLFRLVLGDTGSAIFELIGIDKSFDDAGGSIQRIGVDSGFFALDLEGSAGQTAKTLAAVIGEDGLSNKEYFGAGLQLFDAGQSLATVCELALNAVGATTNEDVVTTLYSNLYGESPSDDQLQEYVELLDQGVFSKGSLAAAAAELTDDLGVIDLVGLAETGIEYI